MLIQHFFHGLLLLLISEKTLTCMYVDLHARSTTYFCSESANSKHKTIKSLILSKLWMPGIIISSIFKRPYLMFFQTKQKNQAHLISFQVSKERNKHRKKYLPFLYFTANGAILSYCLVTILNAVIIIHKICLLEHNNQKQIKVSSQAFYSQHPILGSKTHTQTSCLHKKKVHSRHNW